jgi:hypothetical protein
VIRSGIAVAPGRAPVVIRSGIAVAPGRALLTPNDQASHHVSDIAFWFSAAEFAAQQNPPPLKEGCTDPASKKYDPTARSDKSTCEYDSLDPSSFKDVPSFW